MALKTQRYIPCLRWKLGEYQAVSRLSPHARASILPLIEVSEFGSNLEFDFETRKRPKTFDDHLSTFTSNVEKKWGTNECVIDLRYIPHVQILGDGSSPADFVFKDLKAKSVQFIPVTRFQEDPDYETALRKFVNSEKSGICLRVELDEFGDTDFESKADSLLQGYGLTFGACDLILDLDAINFEPVEILSDILIGMMKSMQKLKRWMTFGVVGTSFPQSLSGLQQGISFLPRNEWILYKLLYDGLSQEGIRIPFFGDYTINNSKLITADMRVVKPSANIRYTIDKEWLITKGKNVRDYKYQQFQHLCQSILDSNSYCGQQFSCGDDYIYRCARGMAPTGNLSTWRWVGTNHHIEMVVKDLAKLNGS